VFVTKESTPLAIPAAAGVLATASDPDGDLPLTAFILPGNEAQRGVVKLELDGSFVYEPILGFNGLDIFRFTVRDKRNGTVTRQAFINISELTIGGRSAVCFQGLTLCGWGQRGRQVCAKTFRPAADIISRHSVLLQYTP
jgi:hypothetical protein